MSVSNKNWALDWQNIFGVCIGGSDSDKNHHSLPDNLSCDAYKDHLIASGTLSKACEGFFLNPLQLPAFPCLFSFDKSSGKLIPNEKACEQWRAPANQYATSYELVEKTIEILNLNCPRLLDNRLAVLKAYNQQITKFRKAKDRRGFIKLAQRWFHTPWPSYFTTRRILLGSHAETYLQQMTYNG